NTAVGASALNDNTTGQYNTAVGSSLFHNDTGDNNSAVGFQALNYNESGHDNSALGNGALYNNFSGYYNTATGVNALRLNSTGNWNTASGVSSLYNNFDGFENTADGMQSLYHNTSGSRNVGIGVNTLFNNTTGSQNVGIGETALSNNISGNYNTAIGFESGTTGSFNNTINIANRGYLNGSSNQAFIGDLSTLWNGGNTTWFTYSDARVKTNVQEDVKGLDFITRLRPVTYYRDIRAQTRLTGNQETEDYPEKYDIEKIKFSGFLAQEVESAAQACGYDFSGLTKPKKETELYTLSYESFVVPLVKAVQEQQIIIESQNQKIGSLEARLTALEQLMSNQVQAKTK
ncbi:MAG: tail fiber domain-containing protein, partial [Saprospiraceae bacterium]